MGAAWGGHVVTLILPLTGTQKEGRRSILVQCDLGKEEAGHRMEDKWLKARPNLWLRKDAQGRPVGALACKAANTLLSLCLGVSTSALEWILVTCTTVFKFFNLFVSPSIIRKY